MKENLKLIPGKRWPGVGKYDMCMYVCSCQVIIMDHIFMYLDTTNYNYYAKFAGTNTGRYESMDHVAHDDTE